MRRLVLACLLFVVLFYVYPLKYLTEGFFVGLFGAGGFTSPIESHRDLAILFMLYSAGFFAIFRTISLMYLRAWRARAALRPWLQAVGPSSLLVEVVSHRLPGSGPGSLQLSAASTPPRRTGTRQG